MQSVTKQKIQIGISHQQSVAAQKYKRACVTVLNTLSHHAIKFSCHGHFNASKCLISIGCRLTTKQQLKCSSVVCQAKVVHEGIYNKVGIE